MKIKNMLKNQRLRKKSTTKMIKIALTESDENKFQKVVLKWPKQTESDPFRISPRENSKYEAGFLYLKVE